MPRQQRSVDAPMLDASWTDGLGVAGLAPVLPGWTIRRPGVIALLHQGLSGPLSVISAGPGWGKTTAVAGWLSAEGTAPPTAWLTASASTNDPSSFWLEALEALRHAGGVGVERALAAASSSAGLSEPAMTAILAALQALPSRMVLVVDDFHEVTDPRLLQGISDLAHRNSPLHVILLTRVAPALPRHRLRLAGSLTEIRAVDLAFSAEDVVHLAAVQSLTVTPDVAAALVGRTEGWPAGVQLALLHAARHGTEVLGQFDGTEGSVAEYMLAEVLQRNSAQVQALMLASSVTQPVCADLVEGMVPGIGAQQVLEGLAARNEFVTAMGPGNTWFRYHPMLRDMLEHALRRDDPATFVAAHQHAARWWSAHGDPIKAVRHAAVAKDNALFGEIYSSSAAAELVGARREALRACLADANMDATGGVGAETQHAGLAFAEGRAGAVRSHVVAAQRLLDSGAHADLPTRVLHQLFNVAVHRFIGDPDGTVAAAVRALELLDDADSFPALASYRVIAEHSLGVGQLWSGRLAEAQDRFTDLLAPDRQAVGVDLTALSARANLALASALSGRLDDAEVHARFALDAASARGWTGLLQVRTAHAALALTHLLRGEWRGADEAVVAGLAAVQGGSEPTTTLLLHCIQAQSAAGAGRPKAVERAARTIRSVDQTLPRSPLVADLVAWGLTGAETDTDGSARVVPPITATAHSPTVTSSLARRLLAAGHAAEARAVAAPVAELREPDTLLDLLAVIEAWLVTALADDLEGNHVAARDGLSRAVGLARPQRIIAPFLTTGSERVLPLLEQLTLPSQRTEPFVAELLELLGGSAPSLPTPAPLLEPLTGKELAMLQALTTLRSNPEIAADSYMSVNTVKAHLKSLYRKLGVSSRRQAVERARDLGLIP